MFCMDEASYSLYCHLFLYLQLSGFFFPLRGVQIFHKDFPHQECALIAFSLFQIGVAFVGVIVSGT